MRKKVKNLPLLFRLVMLCLACLLLRPAVTAAQTEDRDFALAPGARILVLPFTCYVLPAEYKEAQGALLESLESNLIYALRQRGLLARSENAAREANQPRSKPGAPPADVYLPLTPDSILSKDAAGRLKAEPERADQWEEEAPNAYMMAGTPPPQLDGSDIVPFGTLLLQPRDEAEKNRPGEPLTAEGEMEPDLNDNRLGNEVIALSMHEAGIPQKAAQAGFDYILTGSVSFVQAELKPAVYAGEREVTSVRAVFSCSYRLLDTHGGNVVAFGTAGGRSGKVLTLNRDGFGEEQINNSISVTLNQAIQATAARLAGDLAAPAEDRRTDEDLSDREFYQDSPGKRLKPGS